MDLRGHDVVVAVADGAYNAPVRLRPYVGATADSNGVTIRGNTATPTNVTIDVSSGTCISGVATPPWQVEGFSLATSGTYCVSANRCRVVLSSMDFRASALAHMRANSNGEVVILTSYSISGGAAAHLRSEIGSSIFVATGITVTLNGTPNFSSGFVEAVLASVVGANSVTFSGAATGPRYYAAGNGVLNTSGAGANYFPGNAAGTVSSGGQYT